MVSILEKMDDTGFAFGSPSVSVVEGCGNGDLVLVSADDRERVWGGG